MATFNLNKGVGKPAEFKGLTAQYLYLFAGGLLGVFILFVVLYLVGISTGICIAFAAVTAGVLVYGVFRMNEQYGQYGLMKTVAARKHPRFIINRKRTLRLFGSKQNAIMHR